MTHEWEMKKQDEFIEPRKYSQIENEQTRERIWSLSHRKPSNQQKSLQSNGESEINFSLLLKDGTFDDKMRARVLQGVQEKVAELLQTIMGDLYLSIVDVNRKDLIQSNSPELVISAPRIHRTVL